MTITDTGIDGIGISPPSHHVAAVDVIQDLLQRDIEPRYGKRVISPFFTTSDLLSLSESSKGLQDMRLYLPRVELIDPNKEYQENGGAGSDQNHENNPPPGDRIKAGVGRLLASHRIKTAVGRLLASQQRLEYLHIDPFMARHVVKVLDQIADSDEGCKVKEWDCDELGGLWSNEAHEMLPSLLRKNKMYGVQKLTCQSYTIPALIENEVCLRRLIKLSIHW